MRKYRKFLRFYTHVMVMLLIIIKSTINPPALILFCTYVTELISPNFAIGYLYEHKFDTCLYNSTYKYIFDPDCMLGYLIMASLSHTPTNIVQKEAVKISTRKLLHTQIPSKLQQTKRI